MTRADGGSLASDAIRSSRRHLVRRSAELALSAATPRDDRAWRWSPSGLRNRARLAATRGRLGGQRCFIVGNGPSLNQTDLGRLRDEWVFGLNRIYLHPDCASWRRWFYCCVNPHVLRQYGPEIARVETVKFLPWELRGELPADREALWLRTRHEPRFSFDLCDALWQGSTVTYVALQVAFHLGFREVILVGVDHEFQSGGQPNGLVEAKGPDLNHFRADYFADGARWQLPDLEQSETAYRLARQAFEQEGRLIRNATAGGRLEVFPRVRYEDLF